MTRCAKATTAAVLCLGTLLALPATGLGQATGGTAPAPSGSGSTSSAPPAGSGVLQAGRAALLGRLQRAAGTVAGAGGEPVLIQRSDAAAGWVTLARTTAAADGSFAALWRADRSGRFTLRAVVSAASAASSGTPPPALTAPVTVYGLGMATYYGPGFYGRRTACGPILGTRTLGVAHRTLPCGTRVEFYYRGRTLTLPVIDRGPFVRGVYWDLTAAAARIVGFTATGRGYVGAVVVGRGPVPAR